MIAAVESQTVQPQAVHLVGDRLLVEDAQHAVLAEHARHDRHAKVDRSAVDRDLEAAVLRHAALGNVELRHHLDAGDDLLRGLHPADRRDLQQHAVDAVANHEPAGPRLEVNVAGAGPQCVEQGRMHELDDRARVLADRRQRQVLEAAIGVRVGLLDVDGAVHRPQGLFMARDEGADVRARHHRPFERVRHARLEPGAQRGVERIGDHRKQLAVFAHDDAAALGGFRRGQDVEGRLHRVEFARAEQQAVLEGRGESRGQRGGIEAGVPLEQLVRRAAGRPCLGHRARQRDLVERRAGHDFRCRVHCRLPASSKIGKYMSTTIAPITSPISAISAGSIRRVSTSTARPSSSS